jgi:hypothetical protein
LSRLRSAFLKTRLYAEESRSRERLPKRRFVVLPGVRIFSVGYVTADYQCFGESSARPFARRRFNTRRPAFVAIRALKPCVRARFRLLGWNVRFMSLPPEFSFAPFQRRGVSASKQWLARKKAGKGTREAQFCQ